MVDLGANDFQSGLIYACYGGHIPAIKYMIEKGAKNLDEGLRAAVYHNKTKAVDYIIKRGARVRDEYDLDSMLINKEIKNILMSHY